MCLTLMCRYAFSCFKIIMRKKTKACARFQLKIAVFPSDVIDDDFSICWSCVTRKECLCRRDQQFMTKYPPLKIGERNGQKTGTVCYIHSYVQFHSGSLGVRFLEFSGIISNLFALDSPLKQISGTFFFSFFFHLQFPWRLRIREQKSERGLGLLFFFFCG